MESRFYEWIDSIIPGSALIIAIILVGGGLILTVYKFFKKMNTSYKDHVLAQEAQRQEYGELKVTIGTMSETVTKISEQITKMDEEHAKNIEKINHRIDHVSESINDQENESTSGDEHLNQELMEQKKELSDISSKIDVLTRNMGLMIDSDKESIKSFIATQYYTAMDQEYIEVYIMEILEIRYKKYLQENGDTFVASLMKELRTLPHTPPTKEKEE